MVTEIRSLNNLYLKWGEKTYGWGVFTDTPIKSGTTVEICYSLIDNQITSPHKDYVFVPDNKSTDVYHVLGFGAIYNHSDSPNMAWRRIDMEKRLIEFYSLRDIAVGEELTHNYGKRYWEARKKKELI